jgi:hypothetical protein
LSEKGELFVFLNHIISNNNNWTEEQKEVMNKLKGVAWDVFIHNKEIKEEELDKLFDEALEAGFDLRFNIPGLAELY